MTFDAQCDVAAVVYGTDDDPDRLLIDFADDLRRSGLRPVGVIQIGRSCQSENPRFGVVMLPGGFAWHRNPMLMAPVADSMPDGSPSSQSSWIPRSKVVLTWSSLIASAGQRRKVGG